MRPTKLDKLTMDSVLKAVRKGATFKLAADYAGINYESIRRWRFMGRDEYEDPNAEKTIYAEFYVELKKAVGSHALACLDVIENAAENGEWTAAAWKLERIHSKYYGKNSGEIEMAKRLDKLEEDQKDKDHEVQAATQNNISRAKTEEVESED